ncbi:hypothetical protein NPIL_42961 [Nephila pilipes]|uniref:Uncharacterized protein n=1 Tax=Nephila pilipes TaxID=299642 RepID=A0A8X6TMZ5_NEPPI|nr:hypothetical protein NPIL_42961 [Nephila pilipes]
MGRERSEHSTLLGTLDYHYQLKIVTNSRILEKTNSIKAWIENPGHTKKEDNIKPQEYGREYMFSSHRKAEIGLLVKFKLSTSAVIKLGNIFYKNIFFGKIEYQ